jgi:two-component system chemotaxis sensor kinase CheA
VDTEQARDEQSEASVDAMASEEGEAEEPPTVDEAEAGGLGPEPSAVHDYRITLTPRGGASVDEAGLESLFEELFKLGTFEVLSRPGDGLDSWDLSLITDIASDNVRDVFFFADADLEVNIEELGGPAPVPPMPEVKGARDSDLDDFEDDDPILPKLGEILVKSGDVTEADIQEALRKQKPLGQILAEEGKVGPDKIEQAVKRQSEAKEQDASRKHQEALSSIRVAADKLDYLVDLVGELVIVQAQITQVVSERNDPTMTALAEELERLSDELRDSTLGIRMLPIGTSFSKFRRLVRDLSGNLGKEITLATSGADTELDKTVIERLGDPLVHLLRNSIDHGLEPPEERKAHGKPTQGTIYLSAEHSGGEVLIRINDDGRGMNPAVIREKGIERGLIAKDSDLSEKDLLKLIFEPGFSTAKEVTNVSGRGVGMDVVKRAIDSLRGTIDIDSKLGKGTSITIRLPLTLAIIDGLQVRVENEYYVIPLSLVEECVELNASDVDENSKQRILHLRGEIVPYIHLRDWFGVDGENPPIEQIVITGVEGSRVGIVVDTVIGEHQTVIKSLSRVYKDVEGISGATIKGDGSIALILDIPSLVRRVVAETS